MAKFILEINCDTPAFDGPKLGHEISRILKKASEGIDWVKGYGEAEFNLRDINGNVVGHAEYTEGE